MAIFIKFERRHHTCTSDIFKLKQSNTKQIFLPSSSDSNFSQDNSWIDREGKKEGDRINAIDTISLSFGSWRTRSDHGGERGGGRDHIRPTFPRDRCILRG